MCQPTNQDLNGVVKNDIAYYSNWYREKEMGFPSEKDLKKVRKKLDKAQGFLMLDPRADELARFRFEICQALLKYAQKNRLSAVQMAKVLGIPKADMSRIFNHRIERFSTDKLIRLYAIIRPNYRLEVA